MIEQTLSHYIKVQPAQIVRLLNMTAAAIYADDEYKGWIASLNPDVLHDSLPHARSAYELSLPRFTKVLKEKYGLSNTPMSAFTLGNWLVGFLRYPESIADMPSLHQRVPVEAFREMLPDMLKILDNVPDGDQWQKAMALMALPMMAVR